MSLVPYLHRVAAGADLTSAEAHEAMTLLLKGGESDAAVGAFLVALRVKGERASEQAGYYRVGADSNAENQRMRSILGGINIVRLHTPAHE